MPIKDIPQISRLKALKDSRQMAANPVAVFSDYAKQLGETFSFHFGGFKKVIVTTDPAVIQYILQKNNRNYQKSDIQVKRMGHFLGNGLLTSHGDYWLAQRRMIQEGFHRKQLEAFGPQMNEILEESLQDFDEKIKAGPVDMCQQMMSFTFRIAARSLFSKNMLNMEQDNLSKSISEIQGFIVRQIVQPFLNPWFKFSGTLGHYEKLREECDKVIMALIKERRRSGVTQNDILQILIDARNKETGVPMTDKQILMESMQMLVAAHETSSNALSWVLYLLIQHPTVLRKVEEEIKAVLGNEPIGYRHVTALTYTVQVIEESLRLYPPFWMVDRVAIEADEAEGLQIQKGAMVIPFIYGVHHSPKYWSEPECFNPDRFAPESRKTHIPFSHIPFGGGPRVCIGANYAMLQMLTILTTMLRRYRFRLVEGRNVEIGPLVILRPKGGIHLYVSKLPILAQL